VGDGITNYDPRVSCPAGTKKVFRLKTPWCKRENQRDCAKDFGLVNCSVGVGQGCATDSGACNDTRWEMFKAVTTSLAKIVTMIFLPGSNVIISAAELFFAAFELAKAAYQFYLTRIKKI